MREHLCKIFGHKIDRHKVWNDTYDYRTTCLRCGDALLRDVDGWRSFEPADERADRLPRPQKA